MSQPTPRTRFTPLLMILLALLVLTVQGCFHSGGGGGNTGPTNAAPVFTSGTAISVGAGTPSTGYTATATDADGDTVTYSLTGGEDEAAFSIDGDSGVLSFEITTDLDMPADSDGNNSYVVDITATDGTASVVQTVTVTVVEDANPAGYYINTGTASVDDGMSGTLDISDLQAMVSGNRIMMMSAANGLLYDGMITDISGNSFTADFIIYTDGENPVTATANGMITTGSSITGTLNGSGVGNGSFTLSYANTNHNDTAADIARIENMAGVNATWGAKVGDSFFEQEIVIDSSGAIASEVPPAGGIFTSCEMSGMLSPINSSSLYSVSVTLMGCGSAGGIRNGDYAGLATSRTDSKTDDTLVFAVTKVTTVANERFGLSADFK